jgi:hypothetical protein
VNPVENRLLVSDKHGLLSDSMYQCDSLVCVCVCVRACVLMLTYLDDALQLNPLKPKLV